MSLCSRSFISFVLISLTLLVPSCTENDGKNPGGSKVGNAATINLSLVGSSNLCVQNGVEGGKVVMDSTGVTWTGPAAAFTVTFSSANCPVSPPPNSTCSFASSGGNASTGTTSGSHGTTYTITSITSGGNAYCTPSGDGLIMR